MRGRRAPADPACCSRLQPGERRGPAGLAVEPALALVGRCRAIAPHAADGAVLLHVVVLDDDNLR
eukprot:3606792-Pyramimonas_sp.AAC.1